LGHNKQDVGRIDGMPTRGTSSINTWVQWIGMSLSNLGKGNGAREKVWKG
jgi:hypothetical protein